MGSITLRTSVFGAPKGTSNSDRNPGRLQYQAEQGSSYSTADARSFVDFRELQYYNKDSVWAAGPSSNDLHTEHIRDQEQYWKYNPSTKTRALCKDKSGAKKYLYNIGHGTAVTSDASGQQYGVIGYSGYVQFKEDNARKDNYCSHGISGIYGCWILSLSVDNVRVVIQAIQKLLGLLECCAATPDDVDAIVACFEAKFPDGGFAADRWEDHHAITNFLEAAGVEKFLPSKPEPPSLEDVIAIILEQLKDRLDEIIEETSEYVEYLVALLAVYVDNITEDARKLNDFICLMDPEPSNQLEFGKLEYANDDYSGSDIFFNLTVDQNTQRTIALLRMTTNGLLIHIGATESTKTIGVDRNTEFHGIAQTLAPGGGRREEQNALPILVKYDPNANVKLIKDFILLG